MKVQIGQDQEMRMKRRVFTVLFDMFNFFPFQENRYSEEAET